MKRTLLALALAVTAFAQDAASVKVADLTFALGDKFKSVEPSSAMRKATLQIVAGTETLEANFFHFGGDVDSNIARWKGQVQGAEPTVEKTEVGGRTVVHYHGTGTYNDPFGGKGPQENYALLGAMITVKDEGPVVIKLAGPKDAIESVKAAFRAMVDSAVKK